jgi:hypothetical protein
VQDHQAQGQSHGHLREPEAQAAPGLIRQTLIHTVSGALRTICAPASPRFLEVHKVHLRKSVIAGTQILSQLALTARIIVYPQEPPLRTNSVRQGLQRKPVLIKNSALAGDSLRREQVSGLRKCAIHYSKG